MDARWDDQQDVVWRTDPAFDARDCIDSVRDALVALDLEDRVVLWSRGAERMFGWRVDEVIGAELPWAGDDEPGSELRSLHDLAYRGVVVGAVPVDVARRAGGSVLVEVSVDAVRNAEGDVVGTCAVHRDIEGRAHEIILPETDGAAVVIADGAAHRGVTAPGFDGLCARHDLGPFERDLIALLLTGHRIPTIARTLGRSQGTIRNRLSALYRKFDVGGQVELLGLLHDELGTTLEVESTV